MKEMVIIALGIIGSIILLILSVVIVFKTRRKETKKEKILHYIFLALLLLTVVNCLPIAIRLIWDLIITIIGVIIIIAIIKTLKK